MAEEFGFSRIAIIGIGLIGASVSLALRRTGYEGEIVVADRDGDALDEARKLRLGDHFEASACKAVEGADLVMVAVPVGAIGALGREIGPALEPRTIVTDVGSVKAAVIEAMEKALPEHARFVPGHPVAGSEKSGPSAGFATLFQDRWTILTPTPATDQDAMRIVEEMWRAFGARIEIMDADKHDLVLAITSHLPHLIAYNIVRTANDMEAVTEQEVIKFSAGGFRDFTRIAASDPIMWRDIFLNNKDAVLESLGRFSEDLAMLQRAIRWGDGAALFDLFTRTRDIRREIVDAGQETDVPNFGRPTESGARKG